MGVDARIRLSGATYEVEPDMAGETVILLWGLFDDEMHVEFEGEKFGPYYPVSGPIPLHRYRALAEQLALPISALSGDDSHSARIAKAAFRIPSAGIPVSQCNCRQTGYCR